MMRAASLLGLTDQSRIGQLVLASFQFTALNVSRYVDRKCILTLLGQTKRLFASAHPTLPQTVAQ